jgi:hypothetical protein
MARSMRYVRRDRFAWVMLIVGCVTAFVYHLVVKERS